MTQIIKNKKETSIRELETVFGSAIDLITEIDILQFRVSPLVENMFYSKLGELQVEVKSLELDVFRNKRKMDLINSAINKDQKPDFKSIEEKLDSEFLVWNGKISKIRNQFLISDKIPFNELNEYDNLRIKQINKTIITLIHPDLHLDQDDYYNDLYLQSQILFQSGNINELSEIVDKLLYDKSLNKQNYFDDLYEDEISILTNQYVFLIKIKKSEREKLLNSFPLAFIDLIADTEWIESRKKDLIKIHKELLSQNNLLKQVLTFLHYDLNYGQFSQN